MHKFLWGFGLPGGHFLQIWDKQAKSVRKCTKVYLYTGTGTQRGPAVAGRLFGRYFMLNYARTKSGYPLLIYILLLYKAQSVCVCVCVSLYPMDAKTTGPTAMNHTSN